MWLPDLRNIRTIFRPCHVGLISQAGRLYRFRCNVKWRNLFHSSKFHGNLSWLSQFWLYVRIQTLLEAGLAWDLPLLISSLKCGLRYWFYRRISWAGFHLLFWLFLNWKLTPKAFVCRLKEQNSNIFILVELLQVQNQNRLRSKGKSP